jgi:predicted DNA-binding protein YlxM (UPF0122 family)
MEKNISEVLKEATKDILTEDVLKEIEAAFDVAVEQKALIHVEKALNEQDEDYSKKLETLIEAIDTDHSKKLQAVVEAIDADRAAKLSQIVKKYETALVSEAAEFKTTLVDQISNYLELYLEEKLPLAEIQEAVNNKRANSVLDEIRNMLSVDMALAKESIKDAIVDCKSRLDEAAGQLEAATKQVNELQSKLKITESELVLEKRISSLDEDEAKYMKKMLSGKSAKFIAENFDYTLGLFNKSEEERLNGLKTEAFTETVSTTVDRPVIEESVEEDVAESNPKFNLYLSELRKF